MTVQQGNGGVQMAGSFLATTGTISDLRQEHFRFRTDAGTADATPTWGTGEDVNYWPGDSNFRLRIGLQNAFVRAMGARPWELYVSKNGGAYSAVTTSSADVQSVDAGASADDTTILIPRLTPFGDRWWLQDSAVDLFFQAGEYFDKTSGEVDVTTLLSCSRASTGYAKTAAGTLTSFDNNILRITDLGLLVEDARTNLSLDSQDISTANWSSANTVAPSLNATAAPDGTITADKIIGNTSAGNHHYGPTGSYVTSAGQTYTGSCYFKAAGYNYGFVRMSDGTNTSGFVVDLTTGAITATSTVGSPTGVVNSVELMSNGWVRLIGTQVITGTVANLGISASDVAVPSFSGGIPTYTGDGTSGVYVWGSQFELGSFASSYIPTSGSSATRAADAVTMTGAADTLMRSLPLSAVMDLILSSSLVAGVQFPTFLGTSGDPAQFLGATTGDDSVLSADLSAVLLLKTISPSSFSTGVKVGTGLASGSRSLTGAGLAVVTDANASAATNTIALGSKGGAIGFIFGYIRRLSLWNSKLADATLQSLTAP